MSRCIFFTLCVRSFQAPQRLGVYIRLLTISVQWMNADDVEPVLGGFCV